MKKTIAFLYILLAAIIIQSQIPICHAQPYGAGLYNEDVPYGSETSLSIATNGNVQISVTPTESGALATGQNQVTVTSTDVVGYKLYIRSLNSTDMDNFGYNLPTSSNVALAPLDTNTWGYNTNGSSDFLGSSLSDILIKSTDGPVGEGEITTVTYGIKVDMAKPAGYYTTSILYTAVPQTD
ncbi:hypothetical protein HGB24_02605 [Candidatus Saccharibacteria bacterium]|nr:hypothetical protein [Candidatus Saccharibacteria bacterium]